MHFFNPVPVLKLVEVIRGLDTSDETAAAITALAVDLGKTPAEARDFPGFVSNRILMPFINEAAYALLEGVAEPEAIDTIATLGFAHPMGPLALADLIGLDTCVAIMEVLHQGLGDPKYAPCPLLRQYVQAGRLGRKSGRGFYSTIRPSGPSASASASFVFVGTWTRSQAMIFPPRTTNSAAALAPGPSQVWPGRWPRMKIATAASRCTSIETIFPAHGSDWLNATASRCDVRCTSTVPSITSAFGANSAAASSLRLALSAALQARTTCAGPAAARVADAAPEPAAATTSTAPRASACLTRP